MNKTLENLIKNAIPVYEAHFHAAVQNADKVPESSFNLYSDKPSRKVKMWWTPHTLICCQKTSNTKELKYFGIPISTVIFANFQDKDDDKET